MQAQINLLANVFLLTGADESPPPPPNLVVVLSILKKSHRKPNDPVANRAVCAAKQNIVYSASFSVLLLSKYYKAITTCRQVARSCTYK